MEVSARLAHAANVGPLDVFGRGIVVVLDGFVNALGITNAGVRTKLAPKAGAVGESVAEE